MAKSGSYTVKQPSLSARIGTGFGQGLAESLPKEMERGRLSQGLKELGQKEGLSPFQRFAALSSLPGVTPQMIQSGSELLKQQGSREAYSRRAGKGQQTPGGQFSQGLQDTQFGGDRFQGKASAGRNENSNEHGTINQSGQPQIENTNPIRKEALPVAPWSPERFDKEVDNVLKDFPDMAVPDALNEAKNREERYLAQPAAQREIDDYRFRTREKLYNEFDRQLGTKLQKSKEGIYQDVDGVTLERMKRLAERDLVSNPNANPNEVANNRTNQLIQYAKAKTQLSTLANRGIIASILPNKKEETLSKLKSYQKIFANTGNEEEYFNKLKSDAANGGFSLSPRGAASIAYPLNSNAQQYISKAKPVYSNAFELKPESTKIATHSRKYAIDLEPTIKDEDSILTYAMELRKKDPHFDEHSFFEQLRDDMNTLKLNPRQQREIAEGEGDYFPDWGDIFLFPYGGK